MQFLADENIAQAVVLGLRAIGHDVLWAKETMRGADDATILSRAMIESRVVVTFDKDFGELAFRSRLPSTCGVVLFRITQRGRDQDTEFVLKMLASQDIWSGYFWTITDDRIRQRPLP
jgi:predicted nuclease of predicted toxin-antitoxin system